MKLSGSIIPADHIYRSVDGKWIIAGTYSIWHTTEEALYLPAGVHFHRACLRHRRPTRNQRQRRRL